MDIKLTRTSFKGQKILRIKLLHREADKMAKITLNKEDAIEFERKTGTMEIDGNTHHLHLKN